MKKFILCKIWGLHDWTSKVEQGWKLHLLGKSIHEIKIEFYEYAKSYCSRCGKVNRFSQAALDQAYIEAANFKRENQMKNWERKIQSDSYPIEGNGRVVDDKDAVSAAKMAENELLDRLAETLFSDYEGSNPRVLELIEYTLNKIKLMKNV